MKNILKLSILAFVTFSPPCTQAGLNEMVADVLKKQEVQDELQTGHRADYIRHLTRLARTGDLNVFTRRPMVINNPAFGRVLDLLEAHAYKIVRETARARYSGQDADLVIAALPELKRCLEDTAIQAAAQEFLRRIASPAAGKKRS